MIRNQLCSYRPEILALQLVLQVNFSMKLENSLIKDKQSKDSLSGWASQNIHSYVFVHFKIVYNFSEKNKRGINPQKWRKWKSSWVMVKMEKWLNTCGNWCSGVGEGNSSVTKTYSNEKQSSVPTEPAMGHKSQKHKCPRRQGRLKAKGSIICASTKGTTKILNFHLCSI